MEPKTISSGPLIDPVSESDPDGTLEKRVREEDLDADAETGTGVETGALGHSPCWDLEDGGPETMTEVTTDRSWECRCFERRCPLALSQQQKMTATAMMATTKIAEAPAFWRMLFVYD